MAVAHATGNMGQWAIEVGFEAGRGIKLYRIGPMNFVNRGDLDSGEIARVDMAYARVPSDLLPRWQTANERGEIVQDEARIVIPSDLQCEPRSDREYGFAGNVQPTYEVHFGKRYIGTATPCYTGLKLAGEDTDHFFFRLPSPRLSGEFYEGTSGSPVCDAEGNLVALVRGPGTEPDTIRAVKISYFRCALDVELSQARLGAQ